MQQSSELQDVVMRYYDALSRGDADLVERLTTRQAGLVFIGTGPNEWVEDVAGIRRLVQAQAEAGVTLVPCEARAFEEGSVGWVADRGSFKLPDGGATPFRLTAVFHQEDGEWKLVQAHASIGVGNEEALGQQVTG